MSLLKSNLVVFEVDRDEVLTVIFQKVYNMRKLQKHYNQEGGYYNNQRKSRAEAEVDELLDKYLIIKPNNDAEAKG